HRRRQRDGRALRDPRRLRRRVLLPGHVRDLRRGRRALSVPGAVRALGLRRDPRDPLASQTEARDDRDGRGDPGAARPVRARGATLRARLRLGGRRSVAPRARGGPCPGSFCPARGLWRWGAEGRASGEKKQKAESRRQKEEMRLAFLPSAFSLLLSFFSCGPSGPGGLAPVSVPDSEAGCIGGQRAWKLEVLDRRAERRETERVTALVADSIRK